MPSGLKVLQLNWKVPSSNTTRHSAGLGTQPHYEGQGNLQIETLGNTVIDMRLVRLSTLLPQRAIPTKNNLITFSGIIILTTTEIVC